MTHSDFIELGLFVKVNALTLTFDFSLSNPRFQILKFLFKYIYIVSINNILFLLL